MIDGPEARTELEKVLHRFRETISEIDKTTNDEQVKDRIQRSWHLQDLVVFPDIVSMFPCKLYVANAPIAHGASEFATARSHNVVRGSICGLSDRPWPTRCVHALCVVQVIPAASDFSGGRRSLPLQILTKLDRSSDRDSRRWQRYESSPYVCAKTYRNPGIQCCNAPFAWKIAFQANTSLYELIFCACTMNEEDQWKAKLTGHVGAECRRQIDEDSITPPLYSILDLQVKSIGHAFGLPGTLSRKLSIQRAVTVNPKSATHLVFIKNTNAIGSLTESSEELQDLVGRSQSLMSTNRIPVLAPRRCDRIRLEQVLSRAWTRDFLPYPGMEGARRGQKLIRSSANSVMRKLSKTSVTN